MVEHVKITFLFLANFLHAPRLSASAEAGRGMESVSVGLLGASGCRRRDAGDTVRAARSVKRDAKDAMHNAENAAQKARDTMHGTRRAIYSAENVTFMPPARQRATGPR